jgi:hypothetical protein
VPSEALLFARAITGDPSRGCVPDDAGSGIDCEYLEWLAAISPEYERRLRNLAKSPRGDELRREQLEWLAEISPEYARQLRDLQREEAMAAEVRERSRHIIESLERAAEEWDDSKHPRAGGPPNAGWFASTGGSAGLARLPANPSLRPDALAHPPRRQDQLARAPRSAATTATGAADNPQFAICFAAGTPVLTRRGSVAIEQVVAGDEAWAVPESDPLAAARWCRVEQAFHNAPAELIYVHADGLPVIRSTFNHKFHVRDKGWVAAQDLRPGDLLRTADDHWVSVTETFRNGAVEPVYNLCVEGYHTYFAGNALVHNQSPADAADGASGVPMGTKENGYRGTGTWKFMGEREAAEFFNVLLNPKENNFPDAWTLVLHNGCVGLNQLRIGWGGLPTRPRNALFYSDAQFSANSSVAEGVLKTLQKNNPKNSYLFVAAQLPTRGNGAQIANRLGDKIVNLQAAGNLNLDLNRKEAFNFATWFPAGNAGGYWEYMNHGLDYDDPKDPPAVKHNVKLPDLGDEYLTLYGVVQQRPWKK